MLNVKPCKKSWGWKKKWFQILACHEALCTVLNNKELLSVLTGCVWVVALLNPTRNHSTGLCEGERGGREQERHREERDLKRGSTGFIKRLGKCNGRAEKHLGCVICTHLWVCVYLYSVYDSCLAASCQSLCLIVYLILPVFEEVGWARLTAWFCTCHYAQGAMGNPYKADQLHSQTHP